MLKIGLIDLPDDVLAHVLTFLDVPSLGSVACTCRRLRRACDDAYVWRFVLGTEIGSKADETSGTLSSAQWRELGRRHWAQLREKRILRWIRAFERSRPHGPPLGALFEALGCRFGLVTPPAPGMRGDCRMAGDALELLGPFDDAVVLRAFAPAQRSCWRGAARRDARIQLVVRSPLVGESDVVLASFALGESAYERVDESADGGVALLALPADTLGGEGATSACSCVIGVWRESLHRAGEAPAASAAIFGATPLLGTRDVAFALVSIGLARLFRAVLPDRLLTRAGFALPAEHRLVRCDVESRLGTLDYYVRLSLRTSKTVSWSVETKTDAIDAADAAGYGSAIAWPQAAGLVLELGTGRCVCPLHVPIVLPVSGLRLLFERTVFIDLQVRDQFGSAIWLVSQAASVRACAIEPDRDRFDARSESSLFELLLCEGQHRALCVRWSAVPARVLYAAVWLGDALLDSWFGAP